MYKRLYNFLMEHNILYQNQFGFRKNNSTVYALAQITEMIKLSIDNRKFGCGIFVDQRKAFDTVRHVYGISVTGMGTVISRGHVDTFFSYCDREGGQSCP